MATGNPRPLLRRKRARDLRSSRWQVAAVLVTVVLGVMLFAASFDAYRNLTDSYQKTYDDLGFADLTVSGGDQQQFVSRARATDGVEALEQRTQADVPVQVSRTGGSEHTLVGRIVGMPASGQPSVNGVDVLSGRYLDPDDLTGVLVEKHMSDHFGLEAGATLTVLLADGPTTVTVRGTAASPEYLWPAADRQAIFSLPDEFGVMFGSECLDSRTAATAQGPQTVVR